MKIQKKQIFVMLFIMVWITAFSVPVFAAKQTSVSVSISVAQKFQTNEPEGKSEEEFVYQMVPMDVQNPMPEGSQNVYTFRLKGTESQKTAPIVFDHAGVYKYQILQSIEKEKAGYTYDKQVYQVEIYVQNQKDGLTADVAVITENGEKTGEVLFENRYESKKSDTPSQKKPGSAKKTKIAKTGDTAPIQIYMAVMMMAFVIMSAFIIKRRTSSEGKENN